MRARTEDLLTLRDGEPIDAALRDRLLADPDNRREIERLARVAEDLRRLPTIEPPPDLWKQIAAEAASRPGQPVRRHVAGIAAAVIAAATLLAAVVIGPWQRPLGDAVANLPAPRAAASPGRGAATGNEADSPAPTVVAEPRASDYAPLVAESLRLERLLAELDRPPRKVNAGTAFTIANLEDHLVLLDEQLTYAEARDLDARYRRALWRERVDVMNALVHVRYAQYWEVAD